MRMTGWIFDAIYNTQVYKLQRGPGICNLLSGKDDFCLDGDIFVIGNKFQFATKLYHALI